MNNDSNKKNENSNVNNANNVDNIDNTKNINNNIIIIIIIIINSKKNFQKQIVTSPFFKSSVATPSDFVSTVEDGSGFSTSFAFSSPSISPCTSTALSANTTSLIALTATEGLTAFNLKIKDNFLNLISTKT